MAICAGVVCIYGEKDENFLFMQDREQHERTEMEVVSAGMQEWKGYEEPRMSLMQRCEVCGLEMYIPVVQHAEL